jgi:putative addiction module CopG family antidote
MARGATINVSLTPQQLRLVRQQVNSGQYESASEVVRDGLRMLFGDMHANTSRHEQLRRELERGYKATARRDRKLANEWAALTEAWPEE